MKHPSRPERILLRFLALFLTAGGVLILGRVSLQAKLENWKTDSAAAFSKGTSQGVVIADTGAIRLGRQLKGVGSLDAARVWDILRTRDGRLLAATGDGGKVLRLNPGEPPTWETFHDAKDSQALSLVEGASGHVFVGTGPSGEVVDLNDESRKPSRPDPSVQYIWDLAADGNGNLFAATGPTGQLWKRAAETGAWSLLLDSKHDHLLCVVVGPDGSAYAGSDGEGLVYRVDPQGKASVLYDAPQGEIRSLLLLEDGTLYAGTAAESGGSSSRTSSLFNGGSSTSGGPNRDSVDAAALPSQSTPKKEESKKAEAPSKSVSKSGGTASPRPSSGENSVYRIDPEGVVREVFRAKAQMYALALSNGRIYVGTGPDGQLHEVKPDGSESAPVAKLDSGQILCLADAPEGLALGTGDPGGVARLVPGHVTEGTLESDVRDAKLISRFGAVSWRADQPKGTSVSLQARSGNVSEPDPTWSDWSPEQGDPATATAQAPPGRFVQYRLKLRTTDRAATPEVSSVTLRYQTANLAPEINKLEVPDISGMDGATRQAKLSLKWDASDPNDDDLSYTVSMRKEDWPAWVSLTERPITEKSYSWDTTTVPSGSYRVRVEASDRLSNNPQDCLTVERESVAFLVDTDPPGLELKERDGAVVVSARDKVTRIAKASYSLDGGEWINVFADDGLFDELAETVTIGLKDRHPGIHILMVRAVDAAGNVGSADLLLDAR